MNCLVQHTSKVMAVKTASVYDMGIGSALALAECIYKAVTVVKSFHHCSPIYIQASIPHPVLEVLSSIEILSSVHLAEKWLNLYRSCTYASKAKTSDGSLTEYRAHMYWRGLKKAVGLWRHLLQREEAFSLVFLVDVVGRSHAIKVKSILGWCNF